MKPIPENNYRGISRLLLLDLPWVLPEGINESGVALRVRYVNRVLKRLLGLLKGDVVTANVAVRKKGDRVYLAMIADPLRHSPYPKVRKLTKLSKGQEALAIPLHAHELLKDIYHILLYDVPGYELDFTRETKVIVRTAPDEVPPGINDRPGKEMMVKTIFPLVSVIRTIASDNLTNLDVLMRLSGLLVSYCAPDKRVLNIPGYIPDYLSTPMEERISPVVYHASTKHVLDQHLNDMKVMGEALTNALESGIDTSEVLAEFVAEACMITKPWDILKQVTQARTSALKSKRIRVGVPPKGLLETTLVIAASDLRLVPGYSLISRDYKALSAISDLALYAGTYNDAGIEFYINPSADLDSYARDVAATLNGERGKLN